MTTILIISGALIITSIFIIFNLLRKVEIYEEKIVEYEESIELSSKYITEISKAIRLAEDQLGKIDSKGTFKSDDEVGFFFKYIQEIQSYLNIFDLENIKQIKKDQNANSL